MPEGLEAEVWRRELGVLTGRTISRVWIDDRVADEGLALVLPGSTIGRIERRGKVVQVHTKDHVLGLHFGMTGRVIIDGTAPIESLEYASNKDRPEWDRLRLHTGRSGNREEPALRMNDPRRLGRLSLDACLNHLGVDIFDVEASNLASALAGRRSAIKSVLLDQTVIAGLGNLCADEVLWWSGLAPHRPVDALTPIEIDSLAHAIRTRLPAMLRAGGSTTGELNPAVRRALGACPRDQAPMYRANIGGRTAVWCSLHQR